MDRRLCAGAVWLVAVLVFALSEQAHAAAGALDPTFGIGGKVRTRLGSEPYWAGIFRLLVREDGRLVAVGYAEHAVTVVLQPTSSRPPQQPDRQNIPTRLETRR